MDNSMVSARVPAGKKERAAGILASIGATTSDLINNALDYVIATKQLPTASDPTAPKPSATDFQRFVRDSTIDVEWAAEFDGDYKTFMRQERLADYESLA